MQQFQTFWNEWFEFTKKKKKEEKHKVKQNLHM